MNKHFINGKFNFSSSIEMIEKRTAAKKYLSDMHCNFICSVGDYILDLAEEIRDMKNNKYVTGKQYLKRLTTVNRTIEYYNEVMRRTISNGE